MLITVQTVQKEIFEIEFDVEKTVFQLKERIYKERGPEYNVENQKLIYAGVILSDERSINSYNINTSKLIVLILKSGFENCFQKPDKSVSSSVESSVPTTEKGEECKKLPDHIAPTTEDEAFKVMSVEKTAEIQNEALSINCGNADSERETQAVGNSDSINGADALKFVESNTSITSSVSVGLFFSRSSNESGGSETSRSTYSSGDLAGVFSNTSIQSHPNPSLLLGSEEDHKINSMEEMGFSRENVEKAMTITLNNPERALEYLISGMAEASVSFNTTTTVGRDSTLLKYNSGAICDDKNCTSSREPSFIGDDGGSHTTLNRFNSFNKICNYLESGCSDVQQSGESRVGKLIERTTFTRLDGGPLNGNSEELNADVQQEVQCANTLEKTPNGSGDIESIGLGGVLVPVGSNTSISSSGSAVFILSERSNRSGDSETSHSTFSSGDLAGVFSNTSLKAPPSESNLPMSEEYNRTIESMIEMGFSRETVEHAMTACFNNPERAIEYLINGLSDNSEIFNNNATNEVNIGTNIGGSHHANVYDEGRERLSNSIPDIDINFSPRDEVYDGDQPSLENHNAPLRYVTGENPFEIFRNQPQLLLMRSLMYQNPDALHGVLQQIGQTNPALLQLISENQDAFLSMFSQTLDGYADINRSNPRRLTPGRRAQLAAAVRAAAGGDGLHVRSLDTASGAGGDGLLTHQRPGESGDAGADTVTHVISQLQPDRVAERRAAAADAFLRERAAAAVAVAALTADVSDTVHREIYEDAVARGATSSMNNDNLSASSLSEESKNMMFLLTPQDKEAINRLKLLGFSETLALQAYLACEKNEQLAANFLLSSTLND